MHIGVDQRARYSDDPVPDSYALFDSRYVLVATWGNDDQVQAMAIFDCRASATTRRIIFPEALQDSALLVLNMPLLSTWASRDESVIYQLLCAPSSPDALCTQTAGAAFHTTAPPIVAVVISAKGLAMNRCLLIPGRFLLAQIARVHAQGAAPSVVRIPWQAYAHECRIIEQGLGKSVAHGARFATWASIPEDSTDEASYKPFIHIWHFDEPAAVRRQADRLETERESASTSPKNTSMLSKFECVLEVDDQSDSFILRGSDVTDYSSDSSTAESSRPDDLVRQIWAEPMSLGAPLIVTKTDVQFNDAREFLLVEDGLVVLNRNSMTILTL
ncbi:hypothetical protein PsYK624_081150 [Phanerochaete sordida]|uniref:Uncharacterized protein n=1 Tax=Phanerochaete sordida TaxID=48140 RepID=A0A9P3LEW7_9APHY|nr:hypothetical protein PsYK624_081150 [Phanerochaete sordida]